jgi:hypothetical protein
MKVYRATVIIAGKACIVDAIEYLRVFWLVPKWIDMPAQEMRRPARILSLATIPHRMTKGADPELIVDNPMPRYVFDGQIPPEEARKYVVVENPDLRFALPPALR